MFHYYRTKEQHIVRAWREGEAKALGLALPEDESEITWGEAGQYEEEKEGVCGCGE